VTVQAEGGQQILRVPRRQRPLREREPQPDPRRFRLQLAEERVLQAIQMVELVLLGQRRVVGDVVRRAHEIVERQDSGAVARMDEPRGDGKILVAVALARSQFGGARHFIPDALAWTRPFHSPPFPRACWKAESRVNTM